MGISVARSNHDFHQQMLYSEQDFYRQRALGQRDFAISMRQQTEDFNLSVARGQEDFNRQLKRQSEDLAVSITNGLAFSYATAACVFMTRHSTTKPRQMCADDFW